MWRKLVYAVKHALVPSRRHGHVDTLRGWFDYFLDPMPALMAMRVLLGVRMRRPLSIYGLPYLLGLKMAGCLSPNL